ncbi:ParB/RepB/Spo0J family partition protein [Streptomyces lateritius]|uniref:ParB/RepB/Spo0J family partition protein n=1 Tax=Streptomyces lateritius TaxID=67313 RepID=A0ABW6YJP4_9ACTN
MSKADLLGSGASFTSARPVSARRAAINQATAAPTVGAQNPSELPLDAISLNPDNPRSELGDLTDLGNSLRDHGQKTAISIMSRFAYLEGSPGREEDLEPGTRFVVIDGNSRLAAAREAGLKTIKVMVDDTLGEDPNEILESALVANIHRQDLDPLDEARALQKLLEVHKTQDALAARLHRSQGWVSQRLALLNLTPELQRRLENGEEQARLLRRVGNKKPEEQEAHLAKLKAQQEEEKKATKTVAAGRKTPQAPNAHPHYPVMKTDAGTGLLSSGGGVNSAKPSDDHQALSSTPVPQPRPTNSAEKTESSLPTVRTATETATLPWANGAAVMDVVFPKLSSAQRGAFIQRYFHLSEGVEQVATDMGASLNAEHRADLAGILQQVAILLTKGK